MGTVNPLGSIYSNQTTAVAESVQGVGKDEFLKLLVAQLKNQDPMNPLDNDQFITQLATFSSLEQLISINEAVTELAANSGETLGLFESISES
jgi:flagellar basal-body rod modification protein FlgD